MPEKIKLHTILLITLTLITAFSGCSSSGSGGAEDQGLTQSPTEQPESGPLSARTELLRLKLKLR